jgi:hypothetical protein
MSQITELATGQITTTKTITVELVETDMTPTVVIVRWPSKPTVIHTSLPFCCRRCSSHVCCCCGTAGSDQGVHQVNGGSDLVGDHVVGIRPGNVMANAFRAGFHLVAHRALPWPVGSSDRVVR